MVRVGYFQENKLPHETKEEHNVRLRKLREEQEAAERRRARDEQNRKLEQQHERKRGPSYQLCF